MALVLPDRFVKAMNYLFRVEGREYSPGDPNPSSHGVEQLEYNEYRAANGKAKQSVRFITDAEASQLFYQHYYLTGNAVSGGLPAPANIADPYLSLVIFDTAVNPMRGIWAAIRPIFNDSTLTDRQKAVKIIAKRREFYQHSAFNGNGALDNRLDALVATAVNYPVNGSGGVLANKPANPTLPPKPAPKIADATLPPAGEV